MAMDNMSIRKAQLDQLDKFVKQLYDETQMTKKYGVDLPDLEMLYLHIHELIQELLQCQTSDEFMAMIQQLHEAIAGVLIVVAPGNAAQVKEDLQNAHTKFSDEEFDDFIKNINKNYSKKTDGMPKSQKQPEEEVENDPDELVDLMDLGDYVKPKDKKEKKPKAEAEEEETDSDDGSDPFEDVYKNFK